MNLRYCMTTAHYNCKEDGHPCEVMAELGITYDRAIPQSLGDQWWYYDCKNVPDNLPAFLTPLNKDWK